MYGATYYSYLYARCLASGIWNRHLAEDPRDRAAGNLIREVLMAPGGSIEPRDIVVSLLGQEALQHVEGGWAPCPEDLLADYSNNGE